MYLVEGVTCGECIECALLLDWAVVAGFDCVESVGVYWLGVGEDWVTVAGWFSLLHVLLPYTTFVVISNFILWQFRATFFRLAL